VKVAPCLLCTSTTPMPWVGRGGGWGGGGFRGCASSAFVWMITTTHVIDLSKVIRCVSLVVITCCHVQVLVSIGVPHPGPKTTLHNYGLQQQGSKSNRHAFFPHTAMYVVCLTESPQQQPRMLLPDMLLLFPCCCLLLCTVQCQRDILVILKNQRHPQHLR